MTSARSSSTPGGLVLVETLIWGFLPLPLPIEIFMIIFIAIITTILVRRIAIPFHVDLPTAHRMQGISAIGPPKRSQLSSLEAQRNRWVGIGDQCNRGQLLEHLFVFHKNIVLTLFWKLHFYLN